MPATLDLPDLIVEPSAAANENHEQFDDIDNHDPQDTLVNENTMSNNNQPVTIRSGRRVHKPNHLDDYIVYETSVTECDDTKLSSIESIDPLALMTTGN
jgi:hypothetical protein